MEKECECATIKLLDREQERLHNHRGQVLQQQQKHAQLNRYKNVPQQHWQPRESRSGKKRLYGFQKGGSFPSQFFQFRRGRWNDAIGTKVPFAVMSSNRIEIAAKMCIGITCRTQSTGRVGLQNISTYMKRIFLETLMDVSYDIQIRVSCQSSWLVCYFSLNEAHATWFETFFSDLQDSYDVTKTSHE